MTDMSFKEVLGNVKDFAIKNRDKIIGGTLAAGAVGGTVGGAVLLDQNRQQTPVVTYSTPEVAATSVNVPTRVEASSTATVEKPKVTLGAVEVLGIGGAETSFGEITATQKSISTIADSLPAGSTLFMQPGEPGAMIVQSGADSFDIRIAQVPKVITSADGTRYTLDLSRSSNGLIPYVNTEGIPIFMDATAVGSGLSARPIAAGLAQNGNSVQVALLLADGTVFTSGKEKLHNDSKVPAEVTPSPAAPAPTIIPLETSPTFSITMPATGGVPTRIVTTSAEGGVTLTDTIDAKPTVEGPKIDAAATVTPTNQEGEVVEGGELGPSEFVVGKDKDGNVLKIKTGVTVPIDISVDGKTIHVVLGTDESFNIVGGDWINEEANKAKIASILSRLFANREGGLTFGVYDRASRRVVDSTTLGNGSTFLFVMAPFGTSGDLGIASNPHTAGSSYGSKILSSSEAPDSPNGFLFIVEVPDSQLNNPDAPPNLPSNVVQAGDNFGLLMAAISNIYTPSASPNETSVSSFRSGLGNEMAEGMLATNASGNQQLTHPIFTTYRPKNK